jgi:Tol biopolymer transport system component
MSRACYPISICLFLTLLLSPAIELVTKDFTGQHSAHPYTSQRFLVSADGRLVVFASSATNVVANDTNRVQDVFVYDRILGSNVWNTTHSRPLTNSSEGSSPLHLTPDGRYLVFTSSATGFVAGVTFPVSIQHAGPGGSITYEAIASQIYVHDLWSNTTVIASLGPDGTTAGNDQSYRARISIDGRYVGFMSRATNLVSLPDSNGKEEDIFCRDLWNGTTELISMSSFGDRTLDRGVEWYTGVRMSTNGRYFSFQTAATNVVAGRNHTTSGLVYWRDRLAGTNVVASDTLNGEFLPYDYAGLVDLSPDGRHVCFEAWSTNFVTGVEDLAGEADVFIRDMELRETWMVSRATNIAAGGSGIGFNGDGRYLLFSCEYTVVVPGMVDGNGFFPDLFRHDVAARTNALGDSSVERNDEREWLGMARCDGRQRAVRVVHELRDRPHCGDDERVATFLRTRYGREPDLECVARASGWPRSRLCGRHIRHQRRRADGGISFLHQPGPHRHRHEQQCRSVCRAAVSTGVHVQSDSAKGGECRRNLRCHLRSRSERQSRQLGARTNEHRQRPRGDFNLRIEPVGRSDALLSVETEVIGGLSRSALPLSFASSVCTRPLFARFVGVVQFLQTECRCQKQPWTKMAVLNFGSTMSGRTKREPEVRGRRSEVRSQWAAAFQCSF